MAKRSEGGAQQGPKSFLREKGKHLPLKGTAGQQKGKKNRKLEAGMLKRGCWGEREGEQGAARQRTREVLCVCPGSRTRSNKALHTPSQGQELPETLGDVSSQQRCLSKPALDLTRPEKCCNSPLSGFAFDMF